MGNKGAIGDLKAAKHFGEMLAQFLLAVATQKDMEATASSAKAKLSALLEARNNSLAEGAAKRDPLSDRPPIPHECDTSGESNEESGRRQLQLRL